MTATITTTATSTAMSGEQLTAAIRHEHEAASQAASAALQHALEAGRLLDEARATIPHGSWEGYVKDSCGMAPRTARLYLRLHRHRGRLPDRQRVAGMSVRQAARLLEQPKAQVAEPVVADPASAEPAGGLRLRRPEWYREGYRHFGSHPSGWFFEVWPHPAGEQWAHYFICSPPSGHPGDEEGGSLVGPKRGIRVDAIEWSMNRQTVNGMPTLDDDGWKIGAQPCGLDGKTDEWASRFKPYNTMLFAGDDDYRRRGMGLKPKMESGGHGMIATLADNIVSKQLGRLVADAEALLRVAAWADLPAGLRIINCDGSRLAGFSSGSGHLFAQAHGCRPGSIAVAVAAEAALRTAFKWWADEPAVVMAEAAVLIESVSCHELAHCLVADIDREMMPHQADILRRLPVAVGTVVPDFPHERTARDHGAAWAAGMVILSRRCMRYRAWARHRWQHLLERDLQAYGIDAQAVADAVGDVADEESLREKLSPQGAIVARVVDAIPDDQERAALIADFHNTTPAESGHVAQVAAGDPL